MAIIYGDNGNNSLSGTYENDIIYGLAGNDQFYAASGYDQLVGGLGNDTYYIDYYDDLPRITEKINEGLDWVYSGQSFFLSPNVEGIKLLAHAFDGIGNDLNNTLLGSDEINRLKGMGGADVIKGFGGNDQIYGGLGKDSLFGGTGADKFVYESTGPIDSPVSSGRDIIRDFSHDEEDKINLSQIDADLTLSGDQAFTQGSYVNGILTGDVIGGDDIQIELTGAPYLDLDYDIIL